MLAGIPVHERPAAAPGLPRIDGGLGMDVLATVRVVVDGPARTVALHAQ